MAAARLAGVAGFEDSRADEHAFGTKLHHQRSIRRRRNAAGCKVDHGKAAVRRARGASRAQGTPRAVSHASKSSSAAHGSARGGFPPSWRACDGPPAPHRRYPALPWSWIIEAPSATRRSASPKSRAPQTERHGETASCQYDAHRPPEREPRTRPRSRYRSPGATCASTKWPMRHFAMTGMETASWIPSIIFGSLMRETPPAARMSAGIRSRAMTAHAPASCAMRACSGVVTSMITPPFSIRANDRFNEARSSAIALSFKSSSFSIGRSFPSNKLRGVSFCRATMESMLILQDSNHLAMLVYPVLFFLIESD